MSSLLAQLLGTVYSTSMEQHTGCQALDALPPTSLAARQRFVGPKHVGAALQGHASGRTPFRVQHEREALRLYGEIDAATCPTLLEALDAAVARRAGDVILDCSGVTFFGATGVGALIRARNQLNG